MHHSLWVDNLSACSAESTVRVSAETSTRNYTNTHTWRIRSWGNSDLLHYTLHSTPYSTTLLLYYSNNHCIIYPYFADLTTAHHSTTLLARFCYITTYFIEYTPLCTPLYYSTTLLLHFLTQLHNTLSLHWLHVPRSSWEQWARSAWTPSRL
jgi:hypothetical protein